MKFSYEGIGTLCATFEASGSIEKNAPVKITANGTVAKCADGDAFIGIATACRGGVATVQLKGFACLPYTDPAPSVGYQSLAAAASGVKTGEGTEKVLITNVDTAKKTVEFML